LPRLQILALALCLVAPAAWPQSPPQRELKVDVVNAHADPSLPVQGVRVSLSFVAGSEKIVDARDATNRAGQALLLVSPEAAQRGDLRVEITGTTELVVFQPADGQLSGLPANVTIRLLPKGSVLLLGPPQIEAMLQRMSIQNRAKNQEIHALKAELAAAQSQKPDDLTAAMTDWAKANGFAEADVDKQVQLWAEDIQRRKDQATANERALAELALKHYGVAAQLFDQAADDDEKAMEESKQRFLEEDRKMLRALVDKKFQSANAYQLNLQFHQATLTLTQARDKAAAEHGQYPDDAALRSIWLDAVLRLASARRDEGEVGEAGASSALLAQSIKDYEGLLPERSAPGEKQDWAMAQRNLGIALWELGIRSSGAQATALLSQSVQAFQAALEVLTKADQPKDWARTQNNLGNALKMQGERSSATQAADLLAQAVRAYRAALEVCTKASLPQDWAETQNNLAAALDVQGVRSSGPQAMDLLAQAIAANRAVLEVYTKTDLPQEWAAAQGSLGLAIEQQGELSSGTQATDLMSQGVDAYHAALQVFTKASMPQDWALVQNNLGMALRRLADRSSGAQAKDLLAQAIQAQRAALEVYTKADMPQEWAMVEHNLANALEVEGDFAGAAKAIDAALEAFPNDTSFLQTGVSIYHDDLYNYDRAYELTDRWLKAEASPEAKLTMVEEDLTTSRFEDCEKQAASMDDAALPDPAGPYGLIRDAMKMTCQWGAGEKPAAQQTAQALLLKSAQLQNAGWGVEGTRHYLSSSPALETGRASWIALFDSLEKGDGVAMAAALRQLQEVMQH